MKKQHHNLEYEIYRGSKPSTDWYGVAVGMVFLIGFCALVYLAMEVANTFAIIHAA